MSNAYEIEGESQYEILMWIKSCVRYNQIILYSGKSQGLGGERFCINGLCRLKCRMSKKIGECEEGRCVCRPPDV